MTSHDEKALQIFFIKIPEEKAEESAYNIPLSSPQGVNGMWKKNSVAEPEPSKVDRLKQLFKFF